MKKHILSLAVAAIGLLTPTLSAQNTYSGYFLEDYTYRHEMNPAFGSDKNFVAMPALGNMNVALRGNLNLTDVLYNVNGQTTLFTNPAVSASKVMDNISNNNRIEFEMKMAILAGGFKAWGGYNTIGINMRAYAGFGVPGSLFRLAKEGITNTTYDISNFSFHANAFAELALGHSRQINKQWRVGGALKILFGGGNIDAYFNRADLRLGTDAWVATTDAEIYASVKGLRYKTSYDDKTKKHYVDGADLDTPGYGGTGMAIDLGAEFKLNDSWTFSAALLDFGFISWNYTAYASTNGVQTINTDAYYFNTNKDAPNSFKNEIDRLTDNLGNLYQLTDHGNIGSHTRMLGATLNLAAEYTFPYYKKLKFGLVNTTRINGSQSWTDFRLSANVKPCKVFSANVNFAVGSFGCAFGWLANLKLTGFNLFLGMDNTLGRLAKQGIPLSSNASFNFGLNFPF